MSERIWATPEVWRRTAVGIAFIAAITTVSACGSSTPSVANSHVDTTTSASGPPGSPASTATTKAVATEPSSALASRSAAGDFAKTGKLEVETTLLDAVRVPLDAQYKDGTSDDNGGPFDRTIELRSKLSIDELIRFYNVALPNRGWRDITEDAAAGLHSFSADRGDPTCSGCSWQLKVALEKEATDTLIRVHLISVDS